MMIQLSLYVLLAFKDNLLVVFGNDIRNTVSRFTFSKIRRSQDMCDCFLNKDTSTIRALDGHGQEYYIILVQRRTFLEPF